MPKKVSSGKGGGKLYPLNMRTTKELRDRLEKEAIKSGKSLAQELERRVELSFTYEALIGAIGGHENFAVIRPILSFLGNLASEGIDWKKSALSREAMRHALGFIFEGVIKGQALSKERVAEMIMLGRRWRTDDEAPQILAGAVATTEMFGLSTFLDRKDLPEGSDNAR